MKTYEPGYEEEKSKQRLSKKEDKHDDSDILRFIETTGQEKISRMMQDSANQFVQPQADATGRAIFRSAFPDAFVQMKLEISQPGDAHEEQADKVADAVTKGDTKQSQSVLDEKPAAIQKKGDDAALTTTPDFDSQLQTTKGSGSKMDEATKGELEQHTGTDLSGVNIHTGNDAHTMSESISAKAFTHGQDIYFKNGNYNPGTPEGKSLLAHEVAHTVQQGSGVERKVMRGKNDKIRDDQKKTLIYQVFQSNGFGDLSADDMDILMKEFPDVKYPHGVTLLPPQQFIYTVMHTGIFGASEKMDGRRVVPFKDANKNTYDLDPINGMEIYVPAISKGRNYILRAPSVSSSGYKSLVFDAGGDLPYLRNTHIPTVFGRILNTKQIEEVNAYFISHLDADHINAFSEVFFQGAAYSVTEGQRTQVRISLEQMQMISSWKELLLNPGQINFTTISSKSETELVTIDVSTYESLEVTEFRLNKKAIENLPQTDPNRINLGPNELCPLSVVRNTKTGESAIFTADLTEPALGILLNQIGDERFIELAGRGLIFLEYPHHGGKGAEGEANTVRMIRLSMEASGGKVEIVTQSSQTFAQAGSSSINMLTRLGVDVKQVTAKSGSTIARISSYGFETESLYGGAPENILLQRTGYQGVYNLSYLQRTLLDSYIESLESETIPPTEVLALSNRDKQLSELRNLRNRMDVEIESFNNNLSELSRITGNQFAKINGNPAAQKYYDAVVENAESLKLLNEESKETTSRQSTNQLLSRIRSLMNKNVRRLSDVESETELFEIGETLDRLNKSGEEAFGEDAEFEPLWRSAVRRVQLLIPRYASVNPRLTYRPGAESEGVNEGLTTTSQYFVARSSASRGARWNPITMMRANARPVAIGGLFIEFFNLGMDVYNGVKGISESIDRQNNWEKYEGMVNLEWWAKYFVFPDFNFVDKGGDVIEETANLSREDKYAKLKDPSFSYWTVGITNVDDEDVSRVLALAALQSEDLASFMLHFTAPYATAPINYDRDDRKWKIRLYEDGEYVNKDRAGLDEKIMELYYIMWQQMQNDFSALSASGRNTYTVKNSAWFGVDRNIVVFEGLAPGLGTWTEKDMEAGMDTASGKDVFDTDVPLFWKVSEVYGYQPFQLHDTLPGRTLLEDKVLVQAADAKTWEALYNFDWPENIYPVMNSGTAYTNTHNAGGYAYVGKDQLTPLVTETSKDSRAVTDPFTSKYDLAAIDNLKKKQAPKTTPGLQIPPLNPGRDNTTVVKPIDANATMNASETPVTKVSVGHDKFPSNSQSFVASYYLKTVEHHPQFVKFMLENKLLLEADLFYKDLVGDKPTFSFSGRFRIKDLFVKSESKFYSDDKRDEKNKLVVQDASEAMNAEKWDAATVCLDEDYSVKVYGADGAYVSTIYIKKGAEYKWYFNRVKWNQDEPRNSSTNDNK